jgi:hypothetical protein
MFSYKYIINVLHPSHKPTAECFKETYNNSKFSITLGKSVLKFLDVQICVCMMQQQLGLTATLCCMKTILSPMQNNTYIQGV